MRWVALPDAPLDFSAAAERELLERGPPYLSPCTSRPTGSIWEVRDATPPVSGAAQLVAAGADGFDLEATGAGDVLVRQHGTPYWAVAAGDACVSEDPRRLDAGPRRAARAAQRARALLRHRRAAARAALRRTMTPPLGTSAVSPPVTER